VAINPELLEILACPKCKGPVAMVAEKDGLACAACKVVYPVRDDIPVMLIEEAVPAEKWAGGARTAKG